MMHSTAQAPRGRARDVCLGDIIDEAFGNRQRRRQAAQLDDFLLDVIRGDDLPVELQVRAVRLLASRVTLMAERWPERRPEASA